MAIKRSQLRIRFDFIHVSISSAICSIGLTKLLSGHGKDDTDGKDQQRNHRDHMGSALQKILQILPASLVTRRTRPVCSFTA